MLGRFTESDERQKVKAVGDLDIHFGEADF
jgi:hypothetical protein